MREKERRGMRREQRERELKEAGGTEKYTCFGRDHSARPCHWQPVCRCYNVQKVPVAHDLEQLDYSCHGSLWSGQVDKRQI